MWGENGKCGTFIMQNISINNSFKKDTWNAFLNNLPVFESLKHGANFG